MVCVDEKSQCQALERTQPILPMRPGIPERQTHDYARHGATSLFAALELATGQVTDACYPRHRHQEFLQFLKKVAAAYPGSELHVVCDNYATHKHADVRKWLARPENQRITLHFTPTSCSWLNLVECFFSSSPARPSAAAPSPQSGSSPPPSAPSSTTGTTTPARSPGPRTPTRSSPSIHRAKTKTNALTHH